MSELVARAEEFARLVHQKTIKTNPYFYHYLKDIYFLLRSISISDENILAAGFLSKTLRDKETTYKTLVIQFEKEVADIVKALDEEELLRDNEKALIIKLASKIVNTEWAIDNDEDLYQLYNGKFPLFRELLYDERSISYPIIYLWYYLENLYREEKLSVEEIEKIALDIYSNNLDEREAEYYDNCYQIVEERMYDQ